MPFNDGDFVKVDYSAWRAADNKLVYTTMKSVAEKDAEMDKDAKYAPQLIVVGKGNAIKGVEEAIRKMSAGETKKVEIDPKDAFGDRNQSLVRVMSVSDFKKRDIDPQPGMQLDIDGAVATIKSVNSGRVIVDSNHPFAGERMIYEIKVVSKLEKDEDKIKAVAEVYDLNPDAVEISGGDVRVIFGDKIEKDSKYLINKSDFVNALMRYMDKVTKLRVEEDFLRSKPLEKK
ncbi:MAG: peptidylprolyl isomerase [Candidatus Micrarchaeota archaeon]|nr:peptidylprolyl isomerase [Candidatus Micrarchaeota archaeon]